MEFNPCLLIPCFDHGYRIERTMAELERCGLPCLIVDDGSGAATARVLDGLAERHAWITVIRLPDNRGKGLAAFAGLRVAAERGFSHALQIDADGQHDVDDVPRLLERARAHPDALVSGRPVYGDDVPRSRLYGRYLTHVFVWLETLSLDIADSMCGFRVYPVEATLATGLGTRIGHRMDFDTYIMVSMYWAGTPVEFVDTRVVYPDDGLSHFAVIADNARITRMHACLVLGMLRRLPRLIRWRAGAATSGRHWSRREERGSYWGLWIALQIHRLLGRRVMQWMLYPMTAYFFLTDGPARRASRDWLQRVYERGGAVPGPPGWRDVFNHFFTFGDGILDRLDCWLGHLRHEHIEFESEVLLAEQAATGQGGLILTSHLGNMELSRTMHEDVRLLRMNVLVYNRHAPRINRLLKKQLPDSDPGLIDIGAFGPETAAILDARVNAGEFIAVAGDRTPPSLNRHVVHARFMGEAAPFPTGPFIIAALLRCPVFLMRCIKSEGRYQMEVVPFADRVTLSRGHREADLEDWVQRYADQLEAWVLRTPFQWFNFYDFWDRPAAADASDDEARPADSGPARGGSGESGHGGRVRQ